MKFEIAPIRNWFGYTRRERRASFILLVMIVSIISIRFLVPEKNMNIEDISAGFVRPDSLQNQPVGIPPGQEQGLSDYGSITRQAVRKKSPSTIDINRADSSELIKLPGIGPVLSVRIVRYRNLLGGYARVDQLLEVYGLTAETYDMIKERIFVDTLAIVTIDINSADYRTLIRFPYFEKHEVSSILKYRDIESRIRDLSGLVDNKLISEEKAIKVRPYLRFE